MEAKYKPKAVKGNNGEITRKASEPAKSKVAGGKKGARVEEVKGKKQSGYLTEDTSLVRRRSKRFFDPESSASSIDSPVDEKVFSDAGRPLRGDKRRSKSQASKTPEREFNDVWTATAEYLKKEAY